MQKITSRFLIVCALTVQCAQAETTLQVRGVLESCVPVVSVHNYSYNGSNELDLKSYQWETGILPAPVLMIDATSCPATFRGQLREDIPADNPSRKYEEFNVYLPNTRILAGISETPGKIDAQDTGSFSIALSNFEGNIMHTYYMSLQGEVGGHPTPGRDNASMAVTISYE